MLGPNETNAGTCAGGNIPQVLIASGKNYTSSVDSSYTDYTIKTMTVAGKTATKTSGVTKGRSDIPDGIYIAAYTFTDESLYIRFTGNKSDTSTLKVLDQMLSTLTFLD